MKACSLFDGKQKYNFIATPQKVAIIPSFNSSNRLCKITFSRSIWLVVQMIVRKFHIAKVLTYWTLPLVNCSTLYPVCRYGFSNENCDTPKLVRCGIQVGQQLALPWRQEAVQSVCTQPRSAIPLPPQQLQQHEQQAQQVGLSFVLKAFKYTISICLSFLREQRVNEIIDFIATSNGERNYKKKGLNWN